MKQYSATDKNNVYKIHCNNNFIQRRGTKIFQCAVASKSLRNKRFLNRA